MKSEIGVFEHYVILSAIVSISNVLFFNNKQVALAITIVEVAVLLYELIRGSITDYIALYIVFFCNCIEFSQFVNDRYLYNIKSFRIFGLNLGIWLLLPILFFTILKPIDISYSKSKHHFFHLFGRNLIVMNVVAALVGGLLLLFNDNGIQAYENYGKEFLDVAYSMLFLPLVAVLFFYYSNRYEERFLRKISYALQAVLWGAVIQLLFSFVFSIYGSYGDVKMLASSVMYFMFPLMPLLSIDNRFCKHRKLNAIMGVLGTGLTLVFNANGKVILMVMVVFLFGVYYVVRHGSANFKIIILCFVVLLFALIPVFIRKMTGNVLFNSKLKQALAVINVFDGDWLNKMPHSPKMRVAELFNVIIEYSNKPWLIFTGKGYMGTIKDHLRMFGTMMTSPGLFSAKEWKVGLFFNLHEISSTILLYGLLGIMYSCSLIITTIKKYRTSIWLLFGAYWFLFLYGYSFTLSIFGVFALFFGCNFCDSNIDNC